MGYRAKPSEIQDKVKTKDEEGQTWGTLGSVGKEAKIRNPFWRDNRPMATSQDDIGTWSHYKEARGKKVMREDRGRRMSRTPFKKKKQKQRRNLKEKQLLFKTGNLLPLSVWSLSLRNMMSRSCH